MSTTPADFDVDLTSQIRASRGRAVPSDFLFTAPWWLLLLILAGVYIIVLVLSNEDYTNTFRRIRNGIPTTLIVSFLAYAFALLLGLLVGLIRSAPPVAPAPGTPFIPALLMLGRTLLYNLATLYVSLLRGLPILIVLMLVAFGLIPLFRRFVEASFGIDLSQELRAGSVQSGMIALGFTYGAFLSETFRAGIQSIEKGQLEAARSLGMTYGQVVRFVVLPQAIRRVLPPLGNDFVAMIKDSSLVSYIGVQDITQLAKTWSGRTFLYMETYFTVAVIYLTMTVIGSLVVRYLERRFKQDER